MIYRNGLPSDHKLAMPLHRRRDHRLEERRIAKYLNQTTWYTEVNLGDEFKNEWKKNIKRKQDFHTCKTKKHKIKGISTTYDPRLSTVSEGVEESQAVGIWDKEVKPS